MNLPRTTVYHTLSPALASIPLLGEMLGGEVRWGIPIRRRGRAVLLGWGRKPSAYWARRLAGYLGCDYLNLEDGFLRSFGVGRAYPPLAVVVDDVGIYYDATCPSALENLLQHGEDLLTGIEDQVHAAKHFIRTHRLSKYNLAPPQDFIPSDSTALPLGKNGARRVLVIDQTAGDLSVRLGGATQETFAAMLRAAHIENPDAMVYVKTHPEVTAGRKGGYLTTTREDERTVLVRTPVNPLSLIEQMDRVYVVTSQMGFEALLAGKPVTCFGMPWYAGWGATDDRQVCPRRGRVRSVDELFAATYFHYTRYLNPITHRRGDIFDVMNWLLLQQNMAAGTTGSTVCIGFSRLRMALVRPFLGMPPGNLKRIANAEALSAIDFGATNRLVCWGADAAAKAEDKARAHGVPLMRMEDGFIRSVGLGTDLIRPLSLVLDVYGLYFDPRRESALERILNQANFTPEELDRAREVRAFIVDNGISKYNIESRVPAVWPTGGKEVVLVPGQVEDDASIRFGCNDVKTNLDLLRAARLAHPRGYIVYKPHPDVLARNRRAISSLALLRRHADHVETRLSLVSCIDACDVMHTMTSLSGFDALLRGKRVVVYGQPFYAGWGLTEDVMRTGATLARRVRRLSIDELVAGTLLRYPLYWDWNLNGYTVCEAVLARILATRDELERSGQLERLSQGRLRRQWRRLRNFSRYWALGA